MTNDNRFDHPKAKTGQSFVELAFLIPSLVLLLVGMVEVTWWMRTYIVTDMAAREGARFGSRGPHLTGNVDDKARQIGILTADSMEYLIDVQVPTADPNTAIFVTLIEIDKNGNWEYLTTNSNISLGHLGGVSSRVCELGSGCPSGSLDLQEIIADNKAFKDTYCAAEDAVCNNDLVIVEVYYDHSPLMFRADFLPDQLLTYSRSIMRVVADKPTPTPTATQ